MSQSVISESTSTEEEDPIEKYMDSDESIKFVIENPITKSSCF